MIKRLKEKCNVWLFKVFEKQILKCVLQERKKVIHQLYEPIVITKEYFVSTDHLYRVSGLGNDIVKNIKEDILKSVSQHISMTSEHLPMFGGTRKIIGKIIIQKELI